MEVKRFVIVVVILTLAETRSGRSQEIFEPRVWAPPRECPNGLPLPVDEGKTCNDTSICPSSGVKSSTCYCDDLCLSYGDCCIDAPIRKKFPNGYSDVAAESVYRSIDFRYEECQPIDQRINGYYMISRCPETFQDNNTRTLCENDPDPSDTFLLTPVTDVTAERLFRNFYCAMCHKTTPEDIYFWVLQVSCGKVMEKENDDDISSSKAETTVIPDDGDTRVDDGTSVSEDDNEAIDDGTSVSEDDNEAIDDGTSVSEDDNPAFDDGTSVSEDDNEAIDDGTSISEDDNEAIDDGTSVSEDDNPAFDDGTSVSEDDNEAIDDGTSISEDDNEAIDDGTSVSEDDNPALDDGTSVSEETVEAIDDGTSVSEGDNYVIDDEGYPPTPSPEFTRLLSLMTNPKCKISFKYRHKNSDPYRSCKVIDMNHYVNDDGQKVPCPSYVDPYLSNNVIYKNRDCASCNRVNVASPLCHFSAVFGVDSVHSFSNLFLLSDGYKTSETGQVNPSSCTESEVYDPYSNLCRPFVTYAEPKGLTSTNPRNTFEVTGEFYLQNSGCVLDPSHDNICEGIDYIIGLSFESLITSFLPNFDGRLENISTSCYPHKDLSLCKDELSETDTCTFRGLLKFESMEDIKGLQPHVIGPLLDESYRHYGCTSELIIDIQKILITTTAGNTSCVDSTSSNQTSGIAFTWKGEHNMTDVNFVVQTCPDEMKCLWSPTRFEKSEYVFDGSDVILKSINQQLNMDNYRKLENGSIAACVNLEHDRSEIEKRQRYEKAQIILTVIGGSLSIVCLAATVLTYLIFPRLRNNVGKAILSLVLSLFIGQLFQLVLWDETKNKNFCTFVAILSHYSFLAAFFWMNILGFDLSRTFGSRAKMQTVRDSSKVFLLYSLYGWFSPLIIVGACMALHFGTFETVNAANESVPLLQYGNQHICWIVDQVALTYAFGVPIAVLLLFNAVFFADTVFGIFSARAATRRATQTNRQLLGRDGKNDFLLFCKLSCIMGITWLFGFVAAFTDMQAFHIIFILLNSTQGIFIFLAFGCNNRVIEMWRSKYTKQKLTSTRSSSYSATAKTSVNSISAHQVNQVRIKRDQIKFNPV